MQIHEYARPGHPNLLSPVDGGCWFCSQGFIETDGWMFSTEFDCYLHKSCLQHALLNPEDREAAIMGREFDLSPFHVTSDHVCIEPDYEDPDGYDGSDEYDELIPTGDERATGY